MLMIHPESVALHLATMAQTSHTRRYQTLALMCGIDSKLAKYICPRSPLTVMQWDLVMRLSDLLTKNGLNPCL